MIAPRWYKVLRDLWANKSRTFVVVLSIAIGVFAFGGLFLTRMVGLEDIINQVVVTNPDNITINLSDFDDELVRWASRQDHIQLAAGRAVQNARIVVGENVNNITLYGYKDFNNILVNRIKPSVGVWPPAKDELLIERSFMQLVGATIGHPVTIELVDGRQYQLDMVGTVHDVNIIPGNVLPEQLAGYMSLRTLHTLGFPAMYNQLELTVDQNFLDNSPRGALVELTDITNELQDKLRFMGVQVYSVEVVEGDKESHWATDSLDGLGVVLIAVGSASLLLSGFLVVNIISGLIARQKRQIGMMKIIGATREQIIGIYMVTVASFGAIALVVAVPASMGLAYLLTFVTVVEVMNFDLPTFYFPVPILLLEVGVALLIPMGAALIPIFNGTQITAAEAISDYVVRSRNNPIDMLLAKIRGLPRPTLIALRNTFRRKMRLVITLMTLTLAGILFISIVNVQASLTQEVERFLGMSGFDVQLILDGLYRTDGVERRAEQVPGVVHAEGWSIADVNRIRPDGVRGASFTLNGLPYDTPFVSPPLTGGRWLTADDQYSLVVNADLLKDEPDLRVGDTFTIELNGEKHDWTIVGSVTSSMQPEAYAPIDYVARFQRTPNQTSMVFIRTESAEPAFQERVANDLENYLDLRDIDLARTMTKSSITEGISAGPNVLVFMLMTQAILVAVVGGLGLAGTMSLNVLERTREIGVLRAVGATNGAVRMIFLGEGITIGVFSWLLAVPLSIPGTEMFDQMLGIAFMQRPLEFFFSVQGLVAWLIIVSLISAVASLMPAQRAAGISVQEALAYE